MATRSGNDSEPRRSVILVPCAALTAVLLLSPAEAGHPDEVVRESIAPLVTVAREGGRHRIAGLRTTVTLDENDLAVDVVAGGTRWSFPPSSTPDLSVKSAGQELALRLADAGTKVVSPYRTGFRTGVKIDLSGWRVPGAPATAAPLDLTLHLTMGIESREEELVFEAVAEEKDTQVRQLDWPAALDASTVDYTVLPAVRGQLLPRDWPQDFDPIRPPRAEGAPPDTSELQSNVIESWSMSFWGFKKGPSAMMVLVETPDDAAYRFRHPAGGPTVIGPRWRASLGRLGYPRTARLCFFDTGDYVTLAKRYRRYAMESGRFVSLREKIARTPLVAVAHRHAAHAPEHPAQPEGRQPALRPLRPVEELQPDELRRARRAASCPQGQGDRQAARLPHRLALARLRPPASRRAASGAGGGRRRRNEAPRRHLPRARVPADASRPVPRLLRGRALLRPPARDPRGGRGSAAAGLPRDALRAASRRGASRS